MMCPFLKAPYAASIPCTMRSVCTPTMLGYLFFPGPEVETSAPLVVASGEEAIVEREEIGEEAEDESIGIAWG